MGNIRCTQCGTDLSAGTRFCHKCGSTVGKIPGRQPTTAAVSPVPKQWIPWAVALVALVLVAYIAGSTYGKRQNPGDEGTVSGFPLGSTPQTPVRGPDISQMSPEEQADRLFNRVMLLSSQGKSDSVMFFAPMAINAYQMLAPLDADQRYDVGRIAEAAGAAELARAQADTILASNPTHLLGLVLGARSAGLTSDSAARRSFLRRLLQANDAESAKKLPEYARHGADINQALADARRETAASGN
jgi:hypothetical protein